MGGLGHEGDARQPAQALDVVVEDRPPPRHPLGEHRELPPSPGVLDQRHLAPGANVHEGIHVRRLAVPVHDDHPPGSRALADAVPEGLVEQGRVHVPGPQSLSTNTGVTPW